jgi:eukaryotic-like serine/threonine-protein kinase
MRYLRNARELLAYPGPRNSLSDVEMQATGKVKLMQPAAPQRKIGAYLLLSKLGEGGMAEVWKARHEKLGTWAAVKFLNQRFAGDADVEERFLNEGKSQALLTHPNIVSVLDYIWQDDHSYLIMRYIDGSGLDLVLERRQSKPLSVDGATRISRDVLSALAYAHANGLVHRDVKPSNILTAEGGHAFLMDFGIALAVKQRRVTRTGTVMGTPEYMSPEQISRPRDLDHRSDIYSFGCVLYEMLTGKPPFHLDGDHSGGTEFQILDQHLREQPKAPRALDAPVPPKLEYITLRCLAKKPVDRFANCEEILGVLNSADDAQVPVGWVDPTFLNETEGPPRRKTRLEFDEVPELHRTETLVEEDPIDRKALDDENEKQDRERLGREKLEREKLEKAKLDQQREQPKPLPMPAIVGGIAALLALIALLIWHPWVHPPTPVAVAPVIDSFTSDLSTIRRGQSVQLHWSASNATDITIEPGIGSVNGRTEYAVQPQQTMTYRLTAKSPGGTTTRTLSIVVIQPAAPIPPDPIPPSPKPPKPLPPFRQPTPTSGVFSCAGQPVGSHGEVTFNNLPPGKLKFIWDHTRWQIFLQNGSQGKQLVVTPLKAGTPPICVVEWQVIR